MSHRILIAEDDLVLAAILRSYLTQAEFEVVVVNDGLSAHELAASERFDLIITDHQMPGMSGRDFCSAVRQASLNVETPIFFCSAKGYELDTETIRRDLRISRIILKPFSCKQLVEWMRLEIGDAEAAIAAIQQVQTLQIN